ncbi:MULTISPECIES: 50S ribosomal protein L11 methyltransferase [Pseudidiomarina]|uniref:Ribosomal protein L11 methyltransferase n=2 Tax=Pseudidiomarina TaxID=2800384 RepID=A0A368UXJ8_9GAMM|nr:MULTISPECIES: 50S ribosomal protein L11 methyltransferase [Pseudidiomarina]PWW06882.1 [LSU ribosomal protein L11P]-lysine N-methyltransferase [Pseudidiomarina maritima]RBP86688.1 [LSU ribosomal protein L11P]-lysine N-methyltransferase [Pseudidiomarina tainanensis]RCW33637.1 [LSU ribosomal protein L11P]-lysine N-methyltransferase [Pseudidiomarina tainanensis]
MPWIQLTVSAPEKHAPLVGDMLQGNGAMAVTYRDAQDNPIFEPPLGELIYWQETLVTGLFPAETDLKPILANLRKSSYFKDELQYKTDALEDKDWEREWMDNFHPIRFGQRLWVCPSWRDIPEPDAVNIMLDPGMAFGTGTHPTTALCLEWLDSAEVAGKTVVDFGCGSGILAIAALLLGAKQAIGTDIDQQALIASTANAERNGVAERLAVYLPSQQPELQAELVMANILAGPLQELAPVISAFVAPGGELIMSGILERQVPAVQAAYNKEFDFSPVRVSEGWVMLHAKRKH